MESIILAAPKSLGTEFLSRLHPALTVTLSSGGSIIVVEKGGSRVYVTEAPSAASEYEATDLERITRCIPNPVFYSVDFTERGLAREVLLRIADDPSLLVDNDHGLLLAGDDFVRLLRLHPDWTWDTASR